MADDRADERGEAHAMGHTEKILDEGIDALRRGKSSIALAKFKRVLLLDPEYTLAQEFIDTISITELSKVLGRYNLPNDIKHKILSDCVKIPHAQSKKKRSKRAKRSKKKSKKKSKRR